MYRGLPTANDHWSGRSSNSFFFWEGRALLTGLVSSPGPLHRLTIGSHLHQVYIKNPILEGGLDESSYLLPFGSSLRCRRLVRLAQLIAERPGRSLPRHHGQPTKHLLSWLTGFSQCTRVHRKWALTAACLQLGLRSLEQHVWRRRSFCKPLLWRKWVDNGCLCMPVPEKGRLSSTDANTLDRGS